MNLKEARLFVARFEKGGYSPEEYEAFLGWLEGASIDELGVVADEHEAFLEDWNISATGPSAQWMEQLESKLDRTDKRTGLIPLWLVGGERLVRAHFWAAAASVLVLFSTGAYWWFAHQSQSRVGINKNEKEALSNIVSVPRGQQKELVLPDGSKVWLNAGSTLKYPLSFAGGERRVELLGEAFFEVAKNAVKPFMVKIRDARIEVLGTSFNVMDYPDEPVSKTTLLDGMVKIARGTEEHILQPDEQMEIDYPASGGSTPMKLIRGVDPESVMAWKKGWLEFNNVDIYTVMRAISRAYDVDIQYVGNDPAREFSGSFPQQGGLDQILGLFKSQKIEYKISK